MATVGRDIQSVELTDGELWRDGPPLEVFREMRAKLPDPLDRDFEEFPEEAGFWSVTTAEDIHTVSRDWETYSSELGGVIVAAGGFPLELARAMFIGMDPPKHDRLKALFQRASRRSGSPTTRTRSGRSPSACSTGSRAARAATSSTTSPSRSSRA